MTFNQRNKDHWKRGTFPFKTLFDLSRYDFRFRRYRRVKKKLIFNYLLFPSLSLTRTSRSHLVSLPYPKLQTSDRRDSWKNAQYTLPGKNIGHWATIPFIIFEALYLGNRLKYRDKTKRDFNGTVFSTSCINFDDKILHSSSRFLH